MQNWYYLVKGKIQGPTTEAKIREMLRAGTLTLHDIIFRQGDAKWKRVNEFTDIDFAKEAQSQNQNLSFFVDTPEDSESSEQWVILIKVKKEGETRFVQKGPFSTDEVKGKIQSGEYKYSDYIWKKGFEKWERIGDLEDFSFKGETQVFSRAQLNLSEEPAAEKKPKFPEKSISEPEKSVAEPKKTVAEPEKIKIQERAYLVRPQDEPTQVTQLTQLTPVTEVTQMTQVPATQVTQAPPTQVTEYMNTSDLLNQRKKENPNNQDKPTKKKKERVQSLTPQIQPAKNEEPTIVFNHEPKSVSSNKDTSIWYKTAHDESLVHRSSRRRKRRLNQLIQFVCVIIIIGGLFVIFDGVLNKEKSVVDLIDQASRKDKKVKKNEPPPPKPTVKNEVKKTLPPPSPVVKPPEPPKEEPKIAEEKPQPKVEQKPQAPPVTLPVKERKGKAFVRIKMMDISSKSPRLRLASNASEGEAILVKIRGVTGEVLGSPSFYWEGSIRRKRGKEPELFLANVGVAPGYYFITAELDDAKSETGKIFVGSKKDFTKKLDEHRKMISYRQQQEKKQLFKLMSDLADTAESLLSSFKSSNSDAEWGKFLAEWRGRVQRINSDEMRAFSDRSRNNYAFPEVWEDVISVKSKLIDESKKMNESFASSRSTAAEMGSPVVNEIQKLFDQVAELSGWKSKNSR